MASEPAVERQDLAFAQNVARYRGAKGWTQRELAEALSARGMPVDPTAVSRIENGSRDVRLSEALLIADALEVDLDRLLFGMRSPAQELRHRREISDDWSLQHSRALMSWLEALLHTQELLAEHPDLTRTLFHDRAGQPASADEYLGWVARRMRAVNDRLRGTPGNLGVVVSSDEEAAALAQIVGAALEGLITVTDDNARPTRRIEGLVEMLGGITFASIPERDG